MAKFTFRSNNNGSYTGSISGLGSTSGGGKNFSGMSIEELARESFKGTNGDVKAGMASFAKNVKAGGKSLAGVIGGAVGGIAKAGMDMEIELQRLDAEIKKAEIALEETNNSFANKMQKLEFETAFKNQMAYVDTYMKNALSLTSASFKAVSDGIQSGAWASYNAVIESEKNEQLLRMEMGYNQSKLMLDQYLATQEYHYEKTKAENKIQEAEIEKTTAITRKIAGGAKVVGDVVSFLGPWGAIIGAVISAGADIAEGAQKLDAETKKIGMGLQEAEIGKDLKNFQEKMATYGVVVDNEYELEKRKLEFDVEYIKLAAQAAQDVEKMVHNFNELATKSASLYGYVGDQLERLKKTDLSKGIVAWATKYHMNPDEMIQAQRGYQTETGRNVHVSELDVATTRFLDLYAGQSGLTGKIASQLQVFNKSISESAAMVSTRMASLERSGLSSKKYAQDIEKYIGLANKYNFRGGVDGLMRMVEYAQKTRFNMEPIGGIIDKFSTTDISSVLEASARLNVLGGNAALYSDPLAMRYEAINDPDALMRRMQAMVGGYGTFDKSRGEMRYDEVGTMIMKTIAEITGVSVEDMRKMNNEAYKRGEIANIKSGSGLGQDKLDFLINNSYWSSKKNDWVANIGGREELVANIDSSKIEKIIPTVTEDKMSIIVESVDDIRTHIDDFLSMGQKEQFEQMEAQLEITNNFYDRMMDNFQKRIDNLTESTEQYLTTFKSSILKASDDATTAMAKVGDLAEQSYQKVAEAYNGGGPMKDIRDDVRALREKLVGDVMRNNMEQAYHNIMSANHKLRGKTAARELGLNLTEDEEEEINKALHRIADDKNRDWKDLKPEDFMKKVLVENNTGGYSGYVYKPGDVELYNKFMGKYNDYMDALKKTQEQATPTKKDDAFTQGSMYSPSANVLTSSEDVNMSWKKGGPLDTLFNGVAGKVNVIGGFIEKTASANGGGSPAGDRNVNVTVSFGGSAELLCNGNRTDIGQTLMNDPFFTRKLTEEILKEISKMFDGRGVWNSYVNLKNIFK